MLPKIAREVAVAATRLLEATTTAAQTVATVAPQPADAPAFPALAIAALIGGALIAFTAAGVTVRHARR